MNYRIRSIPAAGTNPSSDINQFTESRVLHASIVPKPIIRYTYYAFIFSIPFEAADVQIGGLLLARMLGFILVTVTLSVKLLDPSRLQLAFPPKAFWWFVGYFLVYSMLGFDAILSFPEEPELAAMVSQGFKTQIQLFVLFWISYDVMQYERITRGALLSLAVSCFSLALIQSLGITDNITTQDRTAAFGANENGIAAILSLGLLVFIGLAYGKTKANFKTRLVLWLCSGALAIMVVVTGSRGAMAALFLALLVFFLQGKSLKLKLKAGLVVLLTIGFLGLASYAIQPVRERWERTFSEGDTSGRDIIFSASWEMFLEKPLTGWGPANHLYELGSRVRWPGARDTHNMFLWLLTETGLLGTVIFVVGLWFCWCEAWRARRGVRGALPLSLLIFLLANGMSGSYQKDKLFWFVLAYALASGSYLSAAERGARQAHFVAANPADNRQSYIAPQVAE